MTPRQNIFIVLLSFFIEICGCGNYTPSEEQKTDYMRNELWTWSNSPNSDMGYSESLYLLENGYFQYIHSYSGGAYWTFWYTGKYAYSNGGYELIFTPDNGNSRNHDGTLNLRSCLDTLRVLAVTDTTVVIDREPIGHDKNDSTTTFERRQNVELLVKPEGTGTQPDSILIQKYGEKTPVAVNKHDKRAILDIINSAALNKERNDGRMLKLPPNNFTIIIKYEWETEFAVWETGNMKLGVGVHENWYTVDYFELEKILNKYF